MFLSRYPTLTLLGLLTFAGLAQAQETTLRYKFKEGEKLKYEIDQKIDVKLVIPGGGKEMGMGMGNTLDVTWEVKKVHSDGKASIKMKVERFRFFKEMPGVGGKMQFDSKDPKFGDPKMVNMMKSFLMEMDLTMSPLGEISNVKTTSPKGNNFQLPGGGPFGQMFGSGNLQKLITESGLVLPKDPVIKGKTWEAKGTVKNTFTYQGPEGKLEKISIASKGSGKTDKGPDFPGKKGPGIPGGKFPPGGGQVPPGFPPGGGKVPPGFPPGGGQVPPGFPGGGGFKPGFKGPGFGPPGFPGGGPGGNPFQVGSITGTGVALFDNVAGRVVELTLDKTQSPGAGNPSSINIRISMKLQK